MDVLFCGFLSDSMLVKKSYTVLMFVLSLTLRSFLHSFASRAKELGYSFDRMCFIVSGSMCELTLVHP